MSSRMLKSSSTTKIFFICMFLRIVAWDLGFPY
jgi:hypothetical protein